MPKTNHEGSTYFGAEGLVDHADGKVSQLDPSRNVDGTVVDGYESDDRDDLEDRDDTGAVADSRDVHMVEPKDGEQAEDVTQPPAEQDSEDVRRESEREPAAPTTAKPAKKASPPPSERPTGRNVANTTTNRSAKK